LFVKSDFRQINLATSSGNGDRSVVAKSKWNTWKWM